MRASQIGFLFPALILGAYAIDLSTKHEENTVNGEGMRISPSERMGAAAPSSNRPAGNPFVGKKLYVNPAYKRNILGSLNTAAPGSEMRNLRKMSSVPTAFWLPNKKSVDPKSDSGTITAAGILRDAASMSPPPLVTFIVYNLPNRDCNAKASHGEICCGGTRPEGPCDFLDKASTGKCEKGLREYTKEFINPLAESLREYCNKVPMVLVIEPDSLPNLVTNLRNPSCGRQATQSAYREGIKYAVSKLSEACPRATLYLDGANGGWLGWLESSQKFANEVKRLGISKYLRGFSINVSNYFSLGIKCPSIGFCAGGQNADHECCDDPCSLASQYNLGHSELNYAEALRDAMSTVIAGFSPKFIVDTGRNGKQSRSNCGNWCNARGSGIGLLPTTKTGSPGLVDAYHWLKVPGESDGCTQTLPNGGRCPRFDSDCSSVDSIGSKPGEPRAPEAGGWFDFQAKMLARNAVTE